MSILCLFQDAPKQIIFYHIQSYIHVSRCPKNISIKSRSYSGSSSPQAPTNQHSIRSSQLQDPQGWHTHTPGRLMIWRDICLTNMKRNIAENELVAKNKTKKYNDFITLLVWPTLTQLIQLFTQHPTAPSFTTMDWSLDYASRRCWYS